MKTTTIWRVILIGTAAFWACVAIVIVNAF